MENIKDSNVHELCENDYKREENEVVKPERQMKEKTKCRSYYKVN